MQPQDSTTEDLWRLTVYVRHVMRRCKPFLSVLAVLLLGGCTSGIPVATGLVTLAGAETQASAVPPAPTGWRAVFTDGFPGKAGNAPSSANWFYSVGTGFNMGAVDHTTTSIKNAYIDGSGHLVLKAFRTSSGTWQSARLESTRDDFKAPAGGELEMTASMKLPSPSNGLGYWPAFAALGSPMRTGGTWPASGEIDMMEDVNKLDAASQTLHDAAGSTGHALISCPSSHCLSGYHTYSAIVNRTHASAEYLQFLMDGKVVETITEAKVGLAAWKKAIDHGFFFVLDLSLGGKYPNVMCRCSTPTAHTSAPGSLSLGYVAVYEKGGNSTPTGKATATGHLTGLKGLCLTNQNSLNVETNPITVHTCSPFTKQRWSVYSDGTLRVQGGCLDDAAGGRTSGSWVDWYPCNGTGDQVWVHRSNGEIVNPRTGFCLSDPEGNTSGRIVIQTCKDASWQHWSYPQ